METQKKSPEVRFEGFKEDWVKNYLESEVDFYSGLTYSPLDVQKNKGTFVIRSSNIKNSELVNADDVFVNSDIVNSLNVEKGDIAVVVRNGSRSLIGKHAQIKIDLKDTVIGAFMTGLRPKNNSHFINALLDTQTFQKEIQKNLGATINQITTGPFKKMEFFFPNPEEQEVVGVFFKNLNKSISVSKEKLTKLKNLKKAMLTKMFPQNGASVPEIRFKGFEGEWNFVAFEDILNYHRPDPYIVTSTEYSNNLKTPVLTANKAFILGYTAESNTFNHESIIFDDFTLDSKYVTFPFMVKSSALKILTIKDVTKFDLYFSFQLLRNTEIEVMGHARHYISVVQPTQVLVPNFDEQMKISKYFENLDGLISNHQEQLTKLNNIKKACLNKLFVA